MCLFVVYYLFSLSPVPLTRSYWVIEIVVSVNRNHKNNKRTHLISLFFDKNMAVYFDSFGTEYILQKIKSEINHLLTKYLEYKVMNLLCVDFILSLS